MILGTKSKNANRNNKHKLPNNNICIFSSAKFEDIFLTSERKILMGHQKFGKERYFWRRASESAWCWRKRVPTTLQLKRSEYSKNSSSKFLSKIRCSPWAPKVCSRVKILMGHQKHAKQRGFSRKLSGSVWCLRKWGRPRYKLTTRKKKQYTENRHAVLYELLNGQRQRRWQ